MCGMNRHLAAAFVLLISLGYPAKSGAVDFAPPKSYPVGTSPSAVVVGDFSGDGKLDVIVISPGVANMLLGNGDGTFQPLVKISAGQSPFSVVVGDLNGDKKNDLIVGDQSDESLGVLLGKGDGTFQPAS